MDGFDMDVRRAGHDSQKSDFHYIIQIWWDVSWFARVSEGDFYVFQGAGYVFYKLLPRGAMRIDKHSLALEDYAHSNYAAIAQ